MVKKGKETVTQNRLFEIDENPTKNDLKQRVGRVIRTDHEEIEENCTKSLTEMREELKNIDVDKFFEKDKDKNRFDEQSAKFYLTWLIQNGYASVNNSNMKYNNDNDESNMTVPGEVIWDAFDKLNSKISALNERVEKLEKEKETHGTKVEGDIIFEEKVRNILSLYGIDTNCDRVDTTGSLPHKQYDFESYVLISNIKQILEKKGLKQSWLQERTGIPLSTLRAIINNEKTVSLENAFKISMVMNMSINELFSYFNIDDLIFNPQITE